MINTVKTRPVGLATTLAVTLVGAILVGSQFLASAGSPAPDVRPSIPAGTDPGGNEHSTAIHAWVRCKAEKGKDACTKPTPPGRALGHAHAPGQLKKATKAGKGAPQSDDS